MANIIACPSCGGKLRVADALRGKKVRCPTCTQVFDSPAESGPPETAARAPLDLPLELSLDEPTSPSTVSSIDTPGPVGAIEMEPSVEEEPKASPKAAPPPEPPRRARLRGERFDRDIPDLHRMGPRRDADPDRGALVLSLGIISLATILIGCVAPVGVILGLAAWIMGQSDL